MFPVTVFLHNNDGRTDIHQNDTQQNGLNTHLTKRFDFTILFRLSVIRLNVVAPSDEVTVTNLLCAWPFCQLAASLTHQYPLHGGGGGKGANLTAWLG